MYTRFFDELVFGNMFDEVLSNVKSYCADVVQKTDTGCKVAFEMAGVSKDNLKITVEDGNLLIKYKKIILDKEEELTQLLNKKILASYDLNKIDAKLNDGVLTIELFKKEIEKQTIEIR